MPMLGTWEYSQERAQRRERMATAMMAALVSSDRRIADVDLAKKAVWYADSLIHELEKSGDAPGL